MKKYIILLAAVLALAGCATLAPETKIDWSGIKSADLATLQNGQIAQAAADVAQAAGEALISQGFELEKPGADAMTVTTMRKHCVTFYGSCDYSLACNVTFDAGTSKLNWSITSYIDQFLAKKDSAGKEVADKWNVAVYNKLVEKGKIAVNIKSIATIVPVEEKAVEPAATAVPSAIDKELPPPPKDE